jgi:hypothetical protein
MISIIPGLFDEECSAHYDWKWLKGGDAIDTCCMHGTDFPRATYTIIDILMAVKVACSYALLL